jgi:acyl carrier protein
MQDKFIENLIEALELEDSVQLSDNFRDYEEWDSLARLSLIAMLDEEYGIQIEEDDFEKLSTVEDLLQAVKKAQA